MEIVKLGIEDSHRFSRFLEKVSEETTYLTFDREEAPDLEASQAMLKILSLGKNASFAAVEGEEIVGNITFRGRENRKRLAHVGEIGIVVAKSHWGRGIGKELIERVILHCRENSIEKIGLKVLDTNSRAVELYERLGFIREGVLIDEVKIEGKYYNYVVMGLFIDR
ncbi:alanine acetyltransferase [Propionigenium maris DSM 9537]|uniref:Alanine acetyltransferase n=1 Tax=Propionigenium maris DSM 9537 TaxID=1123000 RepID=A0A9W6GJ97_9FUSO|nr:GNAT family N-acetyltransferase [Propionigenium maris]GLI54866.1 alanine acetyltransferase [Propionigenium maris DSM 9537]